ncbi:MAG: ABC transporter permease [Terracidiphilus sp.]|jgi:predicted permease
MLIQEIRYALRQLRKSPGFTLTAVLTLAFGIGATTAIFSIVEGVLLRPLPFPEPGRLVTQGDILEGLGPGSAVPTVTAAGVRAYTRDARRYSSLGAYQARSFELSGAVDPAKINVARLTASMFPVLGVSPVMGRAFTQQEDEGRQQVAVISYQMWHSRFHGDAHILGQKILLDRNPYEIIGVMPRGFEFPLVPGQLNRSELWVPMSITQLEINDAAGWNFQMVGRLKPGVTMAQAEQDAVPTARELMRGFPPFMGGLKIHPAVQPLGESMVAQARPLVRTLFLAVVVVLFIACANLAGLLLVRVIRRRHEISVRLALGANGAAILRQTVTETLTLSLAGGMVGLALASTALKVGVSFLPESLPRISAISLDWRVAAFAILLAVATGLLCALVPALSAARTDVNEALKEGGRTGTAGSGYARLRSGLVVAEVSVALVLLVASGLLLRSFEKMRSVQLGFRTDHLLTAAYDLPPQQYSRQAAVDEFDGALLRKLEQLPGVESVGVTQQLPTAGDDGISLFIAEGYVPPKGAGINVCWDSHEVMGEYFHAAGIPLLRGRDFTQADEARAPLVVVVNRTLAERYWPGQDPIGKRVRWGVPESTMPWMTVVGEVGDIKQTAADADTLAQIYQPASQNVASYGSLARPEMLNANFGSIVLRTKLPPEQMADALRATVRSIDPQLPLTQVESMERVIAEGQASRRFNAVLISCFAAASVLLALLGIYGVIAFSTALRTHEMAIRMALGAQRFNVMGLVLSSGARLGLAGCGIGAAVAVLATRLLRSLLFQVDPLDPFVLVLAALSIFVLALAASLIPARRAASIEPMQALRAE